MERPDAGRLCCPARRGGVWLLALLGTLPAGLTLAEGASTGGAASAPSATATPADDEILLYHVQPGDTLLGLSREKLDTPERWRDVQKLNHIRNPRHLQPGTTLRMLPGWLKPKVAQALLESASNQVKLNGKLAHDGEAIPEGTTVQTGPDSAAVITLPDGGTRMLSDYRQDLSRAAHKSVVQDVLRARARTGTAMLTQPQYSWYREQRDGLSETMVLMAATQPIHPKDFIYPAPHDERVIHDWQQEGPGTSRPAAQDPPADGMQPWQRDVTF